MNHSNSLAPSQSVITLYQVLNHSQLDTGSFFFLTFFLSVFNKKRGVHKGSVLLDIISGITDDLADRAAVKVDFISSEGKRRGTDLIFREALMAPKLICSTR